MSCHMKWSFDNLPVGVIFLLHPEEVHVGDRRQEHLFLVFLLNPTRMKSIHQVGKPILCFGAFWFDCNKLGLHVLVS